MKVFLVLEAGEELQFLKAWQGQVVQELLQLKVLLVWQALEVQRLQVQRLQVHFLQAWQVEVVQEFLQLKVL